MIVLRQGTPCWLQSPMSFLRRPTNFVKLLAKERITHTPMPNFALHLLATRVDWKQLEGVSLGQLRALICGAEPIQAQTTAALFAAYAPLGLHPGMLYPAYGLAE